MPSTDGPPAGWYADPSMSGTQRYWDGSSWSDHVAPLHTNEGKAISQSSDETGLVTAGIITALIIPVIGFIIGIVLLAKSKPGPGIACLVLSIVAFFVWASLLTSTGSGY